MVSAPMAFFRRLNLVPQGIIIIITSFLPVLAIAAMFPVVPSLIDHFSGDPDARWKVPMMISAPGLTVALLAPFAGFFADRFGRRQMLIWSTMTYGFFGSAPFWLHDLNAMFASRLLLGVSEAAILTTATTLIGDYWDREGQRNWLFLQGLAGPFLASIVIRIAGPLTAITWNGIFLVYLVAFPIFLGMLVYLFEPRKAEAMAMDVAQSGENFPWGSAALVGVTTLFASFLYYVFIINGGLAFKEVGITNPSRLSEITYLPSLFVMLGSLLFWLVGRFSNAAQLGSFLALIGGGLAGIGMAHSVSGMVIGLMIQQTGAGMAVPALIAWVQTKFRFEHRGRGIGIWTACFFFGQFSSPWVVHKLNDASGSMQGAFLWAGITGLCGALLTLVFHFRTSTKGVA